MAAILLSLGAACLWGASDFLGGLKTRALPLIAVLAISVPAGLLVLVPLVAARGDGLPDGLSCLWGVLAGLAGWAAIAALYHALAIGNMGVVAPITALAPVVPFAVGVARDERPSALQLAGIAVAIAGVVAVGADRRGERSGRLALGAGFAAVAALGFGAGQLSLAAASDADPYWAALIVRLTGLAVVPAALVTARAAVRRARTALRPLVALGLMDAAATVLFAVAATRGLVSIVAVLASLSPVVIVLLARVVTHERLAPLQLAGAAAAIAGATLISVG